LSVNARPVARPARARLNLGLLRENARGGELIFNLLEGDQTRLGDIRPPFDHRCCAPAATCDEVNPPVKIGSETLVKPKDHKLLAEVKSLLRNELDCP